MFKFKKNSKDKEPTENKLPEPPQKEKPFDSDPTAPVTGINNTIKLREDTIPVIIVNGVYFPTQKLRFKINDPSMDFRKY